jgi:hypothetical protein
MTEKTEYKEIVFYFINHQIVFSYDEFTWHEIEQQLLNDLVIKFETHMFKKDCLQFVERR